VFFHAEEAFVKIEMGGIKKYPMAQPGMRAQADKCPTLDGFPSD
jgi:hypothetical protein